VVVGLRPESTEWEWNMTFERTAVFTKPPRPRRLSFHATRGSEVLGQPFVREIDLSSLS